MTRLIDLVNFNCDASCLASRRWLEALRGGEESELCRWLRLYVRHRRPVVLGFTGSALADVAVLNPQALSLANDHPEVFSAVVRPFSHDIHLLRRRTGFSRNVMLGWQAIKDLLPAVPCAPYYLPPEFMLTGEQVGLLAEMGVSGVFINPERFPRGRRERIPGVAYRLRGLLGVRTGCLPIRGALTRKYLAAMHDYEPEIWNQAVLGCADEPVLTWRDGESCFLVPDGLRREEHWLAGESARIERCSLQDVAWNFVEPEDVAGQDAIAHYPVHSFAEWMKEFRMLGYLERIAEYESLAAAASPLQVALWLGLINSDVLSAVEKRPIKLALRREPRGAEWEDYTLHRTTRDVEAEEYLELMRRLAAGDDVASIVERSEEPHLQKLAARCRVIARLSRGALSA